MVFHRLGRFQRCLTAEESLLLPTVDNTTFWFAEIAITEQYKAITFEETFQIRQIRCSVSEALQTCQ